MTERSYDLQSSGFNSDNLWEEAALSERASGRDTFKQAVRLIHPSSQCPPGVSWSQLTAALERSLSHFQDAGGQAGCKVRIAYGGTFLTQKVVGSTIHQSLLSHTQV